MYLKIKRAKTKSSSSFRDQDLMRIDYSKRMVPTSAHTLCANRHARVHGAGNDVWKWHSANCGWMSNTLNGACQVHVLGAGNVWKWPSANCEWMSNMLNGADTSQASEHRPSDSRICNYIFWLGWGGDHFSVACSSMDQPFPSQSTVCCVEQTSKTACAYFKNSIQALETW
jgi:hypothetical protein